MRTDVFIMLRFCTNICICYNIWQYHLFLFNFYINKLYQTLDHIHDSKYFELYKLAK